MMRSSSEIPRRGTNGGLFFPVLLTTLLLSAVPVTAQVLDASWQGREQAAVFFQASLEKERQPADWSGVIHEIEKALELSPEPSWESSVQDASGRWRRHYLPYFYLGRAQWMDGDCSLAVESLSTSLRKQEVCQSKQGEIRELQKLLVKCERKGVPIELSPKDFVRDRCSDSRKAAKTSSSDDPAQVEIAQAFASSTMVNTLALPETLCCRWTADVPSAFSQIVAAETPSSAVITMASRSMF